MTISKRMQGRLKKIETAIKSGYTLEKFRYFDMIEAPFPVLRDPDGKKVNTLLGGPAGFSWSGFFFQWAFYFQIREPLYFILYFLTFYFATTLVKGLASSGLLPGIGGEYAAVAIVAAAVFYFFLEFGSSYPYILFLNKRRGAKGFNLWLSVVAGFLLQRIAAQGGIYLALGKTAAFAKILGA
jgi:hypothetical protein